MPVNTAFLRSQTPELDNMKYAPHWISVVFNDVAGDTRRPSLTGLAAHYFVAKPVSVPTRDSQDLLLLGADLLWLAALCQSNVRMVYRE